MKLSNKILLGFFGLLFVYLTAAFAEVRLRGTPNFMASNTGIAESIDLTGVRYIVLNRVDQNTKIMPAEKASMEVRSRGGDKLKLLSYQISGDTLHLSGPVDEHGKFKVTLFLPNGQLKGLTVINALVVVEGFEQETLKIRSKVGKVWFVDNSFKTVEMNIIDRSYLEFTAERLDSLSIDIAKSQVTIQSSVNAVKGTMTNQSILKLLDAQVIQFQKDESSTLNMYQ
jgi:hypothetical protein